MSIQYRKPLNYIKIAEKSGVLYTILQVFTMSVIFITIQHIIYVYTNEWSFKMKVFSHKSGRHGNLVRP